MKVYTCADYANAREFSGRMEPDASMRWFWHECHGRRSEGGTCQIASARAARGA